MRRRSLLSLGGAFPGSAHHLRGDQLRSWAGWATVGPPPTQPGWMPPTTRQCCCGQQPRTQPKLTTTVASAAVLLLSVIRRLCEGAERERDLREERRKIFGAAVT